MKKKLLKPPAGNGEILFQPAIKKFAVSVLKSSVVGVCHQPYFFNPGVSLKFLFLEELPARKKELIFMDTDKVNISARLPFPDGSARTVSFLESENALYDCPVTEEDGFHKFFSIAENNLKEIFPKDEEGAFLNLLKFKKIILGKLDKEYLKEALAESFLEYYGISSEYCFLSDLFLGKEFEKFFMDIYKEADTFREVFNTALAEFKDEYKFRYKNYPFPSLEEGELPFWIIEDGSRKRCFEKDIGEAGFENLKVFPRAATLTIFLRLYKLDLFIHGIGGGNYEWIQDRIIERFFGKTPPLYAILSGTFLLGDLKERDFSYFLYSPERIKESVERFWGQV
ncbi:hypothetical protein ACFL5E_01500 [Candidatus Omnitrophota bacterium]